MPAVTVPVSGAIELLSFNATRGGRKPLLVLSSSSSEFELMVVGLSPILTCDIIDEA
jgi:hypothetical protein